MVSNLENLNTLESLRTKEELINYFEENGKSITDEEIEALKKSYEEAEKTNDTLTLEQLDNVAGGAVIKFYYDLKTLSHKIETIKNNSELITLHVLYGESREEKFENLTPEQLVQHVDHYTVAQNLVTEACKEYVKGHLFDKEDVDFICLHNTRIFLSITPPEQLQEIRLNYILDRPYHKDFQSLLETMKSDDILNPIAIHLEQSFIHSNPRLQTYLHLAAKCIPYIVSQDMKENKGGLTLLTNSICLNPKIIASKPFVAIHVAIHEIGHTLIDLFDLTKGMDQITEKVCVRKEIHTSFEKMMCDPSIEQKYGVSTLIQILELLPNKGYTSRMPFSKETLESSCDEILARMFELDNYTNGSFIIPLRSRKDTVGKDLNLREISDIAKLIDFYENRMRIVTDFAIRNGLCDPSILPEVPGTAVVAAAAAASPYVTSTTVAPPEKTLTPEERSASFLPDHLKKKPSAGAAKKGKGSHTGKGKGKKK